MRVNDAARKLQTCFWEIGVCRKILKTKRPDDFCARLLAVYIAMRVDDVTKIWSHSLPKETVERLLADEVKGRYNEGFRSVRDKLGAHYQSPEDRRDDGRTGEHVDIFASAQLFRGFNYKGVSALVDDLMAARQLIEESEAGLEGRGSNEETKVENTEIGIRDWSAILEVVDSLYSDDTAFLTNSALELFGINRGGLITGSDAQRKGQYLRGIELMVGYAMAFAEIGFDDVRLGRMFKRLLICLIYSYHDNLYTRKLSEKAPQREKGFDQMYMGLICKRDCPEGVTDVFADNENSRGTDAFFERHRDVRDKGCAHFDEGLSLGEIDALVDSVMVGEWSTRYKEMAGVFDFICRNVFLLQPLSLPARSPVYTGEFETMKDVRDFYGRRPRKIVDRMMTPGEILRAIRKRGRDYGRAKEWMRESLMSYDESRYREMMGAIVERLKGIRKWEGNEREINDLFSGIVGARRGFPERLMRDVYGMINSDEMDMWMKGMLVRVYVAVAGER